MVLVVDELYRFRMLMAGVYAGVAISSTYGFSLFTNYMVNKYEFSQADITTISTVGNCCGYLVFFAGILLDYAGPKVLFPIAGFLGFLGFLLIGLAFDGKIKSSSKNVTIIQFSIFNAILYFGCPAMDAATLMPLMINFPPERGYMVIIQKTFSGLGTSILMIYFNGWFMNPADSLKSNFSGYAYFVGAQILLCSLVGGYFIDLTPYAPCQFRKNRLTEVQIEERKATLPIFASQHAPMRRLYIGCGLVAADFIFVTVNSIVVGYVPTTKKGYIASSVIAVALLASFAIMALPIQALGRYPVIKRRHPHFPSMGYTEDGEGEGGFDALDELEDMGVNRDEESVDHHPHEEQHEHREGAAKEQDPTQSNKDSGTVPPAALRIHRKFTEDEMVADAMAKAESRHILDLEVPEREAASAVAPANVFGDPQYTQSFWRGLLTLDMWLFWFSFFGMWGTSVVMNMNAAQMYRSINNGVYEQSQLTLYVALIGVGSAIGRMISGILDMWLSLRKASGKKEILTTTFLPVGAALLAIAYLFFAMLPAAALILPFLLGSIGMGMGWGLGALCVRIVFAKDIGKTYNFMFSCGFVSAITLNRFMFGTMYDNEAKRLGTAPSCNKPSCVRNQMFILMAINVLAVCTAVLAHIRYSRFVKRERAKMMQGLPQPVEQERFTDMAELTESEGTTVAEEPTREVQQ